VQAESGEAGQVGRGGQLGLAGLDGDHPAAGAGSAAIPQRADAARRAESGPATTATGWRDRHRDPRGAGDRPSLEVNMELALAEAAARWRGELGPDHRGEPMLVQPGQVGAGAVAAVALDHRPGGRLALARGQVTEQRGHDCGVAGGRRADLGRADDLAVGIDRDVGLVAVKAMGGGLVPVAGLWVDGGDDSVGRGALKDPEAAVAGFFLVSSMSWPATVASSSAASAVRASSRSPRRAWWAR
jgi:hypothetical protein